MPALPRFLSRFLSFGQHFAARFLRPMTLGVRGVVIDAQNNVLLVRHSYVPGWHLPGGGVEAGETIVQALACELAEEAAVELTGPARLHGIFFNNSNSRRDHVAVYAVRDFHVTADRKPDWEIVETGFFASDALPQNTARATRERIAEIIGALPTPDHW